MENRIKELRLKADLSQEDLAKKVGTTRATIMKLEKGTMQLTADWMQKIADGLGCDWTELLRKIPEQEKRLLNNYRGFSTEVKREFEHYSEFLKNRPTNGKS